VLTIHGVRVVRDRKKVGKPWNSRWGVRKKQMIIIMITIIVHILTVACVPPKQTALPPHNESILCHICFFLISRNVFPMEAVISIILVALVGFLGVQVLAQSLLHDLWTFWFCFVIATSQFSLIRSVQPDSASPVHVSEGSNVVKRHSVNVSLLHCHVTVMTVM